MGATSLDRARDHVRELKKQIVGVIEERKQISASIDAMRVKTTAMNDQLKKARAQVGRYTSNEAIDEEIRRIEDYMAHNTIDIKTEKGYMVEIKELNKKRDEVRQLEVMEGKRAPGGQGMSLTELFDARKKVDVRLDEWRAKEKEAVEVMNVEREKNQPKDKDRFENLFQERKGIRDKISEKIGAIRELRTAYKAEDDLWFEHDRVVKNLKWQIRQKQFKDREENKEKYEAEKKAKQEEYEKEKEYRKNFDEDGNPREKFMDFDLGQRISICEQLMVFLGKYQLKEEKAAVAATVKDGRTVEAPSGVTTFKKKEEDDPLGLNSFMVDEVVSKKSKKKDKKKKANAEKNDDTALLADGEVVSLRLDIQTMSWFTDMSLAVPVNSDDVESSIAQLKLKLAYYNEQAEAGLTLKDVVKAERDAKKGGGKKAEKKAEKEEAKPKEAKPKEEAKPAAEEKSEAPKPGRDFGAEKLARKIAEMPDVDPDIDLAAMRAKAQGAKMSDEEKKARGLLYDASIASAVRDETDSEDDGGADIEGGDPFAGLDDY